MVTLNQEKVPQGLVPGDFEMSLGNILSRKPAGENKGEIRMMKKESQYRALDNVNFIDCSRVTTRTLIEPWQPISSVDRGISKI